MYNELYEIWKKEKQTEDVQRLPKSFYVKIADYIKRLKEENRMLDKRTTKAKLLDSEFRNVKTMVGELFGLRNSKLVENTFARETIARDDLTAEEEKLYEKFFPLAEAWHVFPKTFSAGVYCVSTRMRNKRWLFYVSFRKFPLWLDLI